MPANPIPNCRPAPRRAPRVFAAALLLFAIVAGATTSSAGEFVPGIEDLPLMDELQAIDGSGFAFDSASGRLVEAYAGGNVTREAVEAFYDRTLPELGWTETGDQAWQREGETLVIEFVEGAGPLTVRFQLAPK